MDVRTAFLQALRFLRTIFVRPPREKNKPNVLWKLLAPAYGLTESGRLLYLTSNCALISEHGLTRSKYDYTLYYSRNDGGALDFVLAVQVDYYTYTGSSTRMAAFESFLSRTFEVIKLERNSLSVMGCTITQSADYSITLDQNQNLNLLYPSLLLAAIDKSKNGPASAHQAKLYRRVIG